VSLPPVPEAPKQPDIALAGSVATRVWDAVKRLATITEHLRALDKEDARMHSQLLELSRVVFDLARDVREMIGQMKGIEKRLEDRDRLVEATIILRIKEEMEKVRAELRAP